MAIRITALVLIFVASTVGWMVRSGASVKVSPQVKSRYAMLEALDLVPNSPDTYLNLARTLALQGRFPAAIKACSKAIEIAWNQEIPRFLEVKRSVSKYRRERSFYRILQKN